MSRVFAGGEARDVSRERFHVSVGAKPVNYETCDDCPQKTESDFLDQLFNVGELLVLVVAACEFVFHDFHLPAGRPWILASKSLSGWALVVRKVPLRATSVRGSAGGACCVGPVLVSWAVSAVAFVAFFAFVATVATVAAAAIVAWEAL